MRCLLDLDGVLADFIGGACRAHDVPNPYGRRPLGDAAGCWDVAVLLGLTDEEFWEPLCWSDFWENLEPTPECDEIIRTLEGAFGRANICLLSHPYNSESAAGKVEWIEEHLPAYRDRWLLGAAKEFCAAPDHILVDDKEANCTGFVEAGGGAILYPRPWNRHYTVTAPPLEYLQYRLDEIMAPY